jgi:XTP/dITP diphosphohydrolase
MTSRLRLVCASANPDKVAEIAAILGDAVDLVPRPMHVPDVVEDATTLLGNARLKAAAIAAACGAAAVADDTGLFVDAIDGAPGVHTARYAGEQATYAANRAKLLQALDGVTGSARAAQFRTVAIVVWPDGHEVAAEGVCAGRIAFAETGARGFGYDAVFIADDGDGRTFAEMSEDEKHAISHRGRAFTALLHALRTADR